MSTTYYYGQVNLTTRNREALQLGKASTLLKPVFFDTETDDNAHIHVLPDLNDRECLNVDEFCEKLKTIELDTDITDKLIRGLGYDGNETIFAEDAINALVKSPDNNILAASLTYVTDSTHPHDDCYTGATYYISENLRIRTDLTTMRAFYEELDNVLGADNIDYANLAGRYIHEAYLEKMLKGITDSAKREAVRENIAKRMSGLISDPKITPF